MRSPFWDVLDRLPGARVLKNLNIGLRLMIGFGALVVLTLLVIAFSYLGSFSARGIIDRTGEVRVPVALASSQAQADLLRMLGDVRGYLALGQGELRDSYNHSRQAFEADLAELERLSPHLNPANQQRLDELKATFAEWSELPKTLFELRDDQLEREPAYRILATEGIRLGGTILIDTNSLIEAQGKREATADNIARLADMAQFQGTFASMLSGLRGYVTTRNRTFKGEYEANLAANKFAWERLVDHRASLTPIQQSQLDSIAKNREEFLGLPDQEIFKVLESDRYREDLYLFTTEAVPLTEKMQQLLEDMTLDQQNLLQFDLNAGRRGLTIANQQTLTIGIIAAILAVGLALVFRENIAGPVRRLTRVAEEIRSGDLGAQARVEASDEIGTLAITFNSMTSQLRNTLFQVRKEKKRADDLLNVVIPIGVELSSEKDFNRLLEKMLVEAKSFCHANAGALYLRRTGEDHLRFVILRNNAQNLALGGTTGKDIPFLPLPLRDADGKPNHRNVVTHVALTGVSINIGDTAKAEEFDFSFPENGDNPADYLAATSMLTLPLKNNEDEILGIMQLLDAQDPDTHQVLPFDQNLQQMMESFSSLAAAALQAYIREQSLRREIQQLRIEIDETRRQQQVSEIVDTDFFANLQARAQEIRRRGRHSKADKSDPPESNS
jgi:CHASE3 domain sensor protein